MKYYVDSVLGNDSNDGLSRQTALATVEKINMVELCGGDEILFKSGCSFSGTLRPKRRKDSGFICIGSYGVGDKPLLIGTDEATILLEDISFIKIEDIALTNPNGLYGVLIINESGGEMQSLHVKKCEIFNVYGGHEEFRIYTGGIVATSGKTSPGWFRDLLIEDNHIHDVCRTGVILHTYWSNRPWKTWAENEYVSDSESWWPSYEVVFRGNLIERPAGDAMVLIGAIDPLMEWNTAYEVMANPVPPCANAGIWPQSTENCVVQYNEVGYSHKPEGCNDAQGFDVDLSCRNTIVQYNYSHDNEGGFLLLCELGQTDEYGYTGTIVKNNVSVNDGNTKGELIALVGPVRGVTIENNTMYSSGNVDRIVEVWTDDGTDQAKNVTFRNNIFISNGLDNRFNICNGKNFVFEGNLYWGTHRTVPAGHKDAVVLDPGLIDSGAIGIGRETAEKYAPVNTVSSGISSIRLAEKDFSGNKCDKLDYLGAFYKGEGK